MGGCSRQDREWAEWIRRISLLYIQSALLCAANIDNIQGRVLLQTSPFHAYDTQSQHLFVSSTYRHAHRAVLLEVVDHARRFATELERVGISK